MPYTIQAGDTLWSIAARFLGSPNKWPELWRANAEAIERDQRRYSARRRMRGPDWIFAGSTLVIPPTSDE